MAPRDFNSQEDFTEEQKDIIAKNTRPVKELTSEEKLRSKYCAVGEHKTEEKIFLCKHCKLTYCFEHGDEDNNLCNECILEHNIKVR